MKFKTFNTKNKREYIYDDYEIEKLFDCDSRRDKFISREDYEYYINNISDFIGDDEDPEKAIKEYKEYWNDSYRNILDGEEYLTALIEYEEWTSPTGVKPVFKVIEVIK